jgi:hypothetical protein
MISIRIFILGLAGCFWASAADSRFIGVAAADGSFTIDGARVPGNATVFEGSTIETGNASVVLELVGGVRVVVDAQSRGRVFGNHLLLEAGRAQIERGAEYKIESLSLRVSQASPAAKAAVTVQDGNAVEVGAPQGDVSVTNKEQVLVARVGEGRSVQLKPAQAASSEFALTGCVSRLTSSFMMRDEVSGVVVELRGADVHKQVGNRVEITGTLLSSVRAAAPAAEAVQVLSVKTLGTGCSATIALTAKNGERSRAEKTASAGGTHTAVIAGVAVAAGAGAAVGVVMLRESQPALSPGR